MIHAREQIALSSGSQLLQVGSNANITASFSRGSIAHYYVVSKGQIIEHGQCSPSSDIQARTKHPRLCKKGRISKTCYISFPVTSSMVPTFTVIVSRKNLAASSIAFDVRQSIENQMSLEFQNVEVRPGNQTAFTVRAPPASYIAVVAVDQSVYIQQEKNQLTNDKLYLQAGRFDEHKGLAPKQYQCGWNVHWNCRCQCYGNYTIPTAKTKEQPTETPIRPLPVVGDKDAIRPLTLNGKNETDLSRRPMVMDDEPALKVHPIPNGRSCCPRNCTKLIFHPRNCFYYKAASYFHAIGVQISDNDIKPPKSCRAQVHPPRPAVTYDCCFPLRVYEVPAFPLSSPITDPPTSGMVPTLVRKHFPETWLWIERKLRNNQTSLIEKVTVPDTITSWVADAFAVSSFTPMTIAHPATLRVFKPFFVNINLPYSVIRGELVEISVAVFNYLEINLTAFINLTVNSNELRVVHSKDKTDVNQLSRTVQVAGGDSRSINYFLLPLRDGYLSIQATAQSSFAADSVKRSLLVEPEGVKEEYSQSLLMCPEGGNFCETHQFDVSLPPNFVSDSESAIASVTVNYMGPTVNGLESLLRLPTGCGEQNMLHFAPAVYIAHYLDTIGQLDSATRKKALHFMQTGYQREMTYQRADGSYSAFGNSDRCGSMWLTAFVIRSFGQADGLIGMSIDQTVQQKAINFIVTHQNKDGSFPPVCQPLHKEMQGCSGGSCTLTAYVTLALLEAGVLPTHASVRSALTYLSSNCITSNCGSPYTLALLFYTLNKAGVAGNKTDKVLNLLQTCATNHTYWQYTKTPICQDHVWSYSCRSRSCDVETTAYALLAFINNGKISDSLRTVQWLIEQRNPRGGFKSTQDTVVALQALARYAALTMWYGPATAELSTQDFNHTFAINPSNAMQVQSVQLLQLPTVLNVSVCGKGCVLTSVGVKYNVPRPDATAAFDVSAIACKQKKTFKYLVTICNRWIRDDTNSSNMAVTEITLFSGFLPIQSELKQLQKEGKCMTKRTEFEGRVLRLYFDEVTQTECCFNVTMKRASVVEDLKGVPVITYNYYEPDQRGGTMIYPRKTC